MPPVVVFSTTSDIEASVVLALLDSQGIAAFRITGHPQAIWPMSMSPLGEVRIAVPEDAADDARRIIESHREDVGARVVRLRNEFEDIESRIGYRFKDRGLLEHALTHKSRAAEDVSGGVADNESLEFLGDAVLGLVVADALFRQYPNYDEGQKSKIKASIVSTHALGRPLPEYRIAGEAGPDHRKVFSVEVVVGAEVLGAASGKAKKEAEQEAARLALEKLA